MCADFPVPRRHWRLLLLLAAAAIFPGCSPPPAPAPPPPPPLALRALTFNLRYPNESDGENYWPHRVEMVAATILSATPDIVGVQEAMRSQLDDLKPLLPGYGEAGVGRDDGVAAGEYSAILFREAALELRESGTFWLSDTPETPGSRTWGHICARICTWARLTDRRSGRSFYHFNTHWDNQSEPARRKSARLIASRIAARAHPDEPFFLTGDLNCGEDSEAVTFLKGKAADSTLTLSDTFRAVHPDDKAAGTVHFWSGRRDDAKIDYILVPPGTVTSEAAILNTTDNGRWPSDHYPVRAAFVLPAP